MTEFDPIRFNRILTEVTDAELPTVREQLAAVAGPETLHQIDALVRPRLLQLQVVVRGDDIDWGAVESDRESIEPGPLNLPYCSRVELEQLTLALTHMFRVVLRWWSRATEVPVGVEHIWWISTSVLEAADDAEPEDLEPLEGHLWGLARRCEMIDAGHIDEALLDIASLVDNQLEDTALETAEDLAQLLLPMGGTRLLQALISD